jgi:Flp pilus assembly protein TadG
MRKSLKTERAKLRGTSLALLALLTPVLLGLVAVSVDLAVLATARAQLKTVADASAMAGAYQLASENRIRGSVDLSAEINSALAHAKTTALSNKVLGQAAAIIDNASNSASGDVVIGAVDSVSHLWTPPPLANVKLTNSVMVSAQRSSNHSGIVPTLFGPMMGFNGTALNVKSVATVRNYAITGYKNTSNQQLNANLLPIVLDVDTYNKMLTNDPSIVTDLYSYNPTTGAVTSGPDGVYESKLYPVASGSPGNWGTVNMGVENNSTSTLSDQIENGITPAQLATFPGGKIELSTATSPPSITLNGNPGISSGIKSSVQSIIGKPVTIPIYDQNGGNGNNSWYRVIGFAGVRIMAESFQGNPKYVTIQPALVQDPTAILGAAQSSWTSGGVVRVNLSQ